jgi:TonB family protein
MRLLTPTPALLTAFVLTACSTVQESSIRPCPPGAGDPQAEGARDLATRPGVVPPRPADPEAAVALLEREYPEDLRAVGLGGTVRLLVHVDAYGRVLEAQIEEGSGLPLLDDAAIAVAEALEFRPGRRGDCTVPVWVRMPIEFDSGD